MSSQTISSEESPAIYGRIVIEDYREVFNVHARRDQLGNHQPETFHQVILNGKNLSGHLFSKVDIRIREPKFMVTNPAGSADTILMDLPKSDFVFLEGLLKKTIYSGDSPQRSLIIEYHSTSNHYEYHATFMIQ